MSDSKDSKVSNELLEDSKNINEAGGDNNGVSDGAFIKYIKSIFPSVVTLLSFEIIFES